MAGVVQFDKPLPNEDVDVFASAPPSPLAVEAFHGPVGSLVRKMEPETEADSFSLLASMLVTVGNIMGRNAYVVAGNSRHYAVLYAALVGETSKARKGTSWSVARKRAQEIDPNWSQKCVTSGLSTGEGTIWMIHDPIEKKEPIKDKGGKVVEYDAVITDHGISDKRLMVVEGEFGQQLKVMQREGNTLSAVIRNAWDSPEYLRAMSKSNAAVASNPHISIVGHITHEELRHLLSQSDSFNGFANRFIWGYVRRSKLLPNGGEMERLDLLHETADIQKAVALAYRGGRLHFDGAAQELWNAGYPELSASHLGLFGAVTSRSEAQVVRLALLYALLDGAESINEVHLRAALAVWKFSEDSARFLFGGNTERSEAKRILAALRDSGARGMAKAEINSTVFKRNLEASRLNEALAILKGAGVVDSRTEATQGRDREVWFPIAKEVSLAS